MDPHALMEALVKERPVFHSEADFQHAFAWQVHHARPRSAIRLEYRVPWVQSGTYVDIASRDGSASCFIELKYKTTAATLAVGDEQFTLRNHGAVDCSRYDFWKDVSRLENCLRPGDRGIAILLSNDPSLWSGRISSAVDVQFRLNPGRTVQGTLQWTRDTYPGRTRERASPIVLRGTYTVDWREFSPAHGLRYVAVIVDPS